MHKLENIGLVIPRGRRRVRNLRIRMAEEITPDDLKHYLNILKHALRSIEFQCRRGSFPGLATLIRDHIRDIRLAADGLELACSQNQENQSSPGMRMTYTPEKKKK
jgi:hypothetical protein